MRARHFTHFKKTPQNFAFFVGFVVAPILTLWYCTETDRVSEVCHSTVMPHPSISFGTFRNVTMTSHLGQSPMMFFYSGHHVLVSLIYWAKFTFPL